MAGPKGPVVDLEPKLRAALTLYTFTVVGLFLLTAPWTPVWEQATLALLPTALGSWARSGWLRGVVSGLGAVDLVVALQIALELRRTHAAADQAVVSRRQ